MQNISLTISDDTTTGVIALEMGDELLAAIWLSISVKKGSWWANRDFGSEVYKLRRAKYSETTKMKCKNYVEDSLAWLKTTGRADSIDVTVSDWLDTAGKIRGIVFQAVITKPDKTTVTFEDFVYVGAQ